MLGEMTTPTEWSISGKIKGAESEPFRTPKSVSGWRIKLSLIAAGISPVSLPVPAAIDKAVRRNVVHFVHCILEGFTRSAFSRQDSVEDRPADTGTGKTQKIFVFVRLRSKNYVGPSLALLKGLGDSTVAANTA